MYLKFAIENENVKMKAGRRYGGESALRMGTPTLSL
jgi:hypothetical protein